MFVAEKRTNMLIYAPSGATYNVPTDTFTRGSYATAAYPPVIGGNGLMYPVTSGSVNPFRSQTYGTLLFQNASGTTCGWEQMDDNAAVTTAITNLMAALQADQQAVTLSSDGTVTVAS